MPFVIELISKNPNRYRVRNKITNRIISNNTTLLKAKKQIMLLHYIDSLNNKK